MMLGAIPIIADNRIRAAMEQGEFEHLGGVGRPLRDLDSRYDHDWWLKQMLQREQLTADELAIAREEPKPARPQRNV